MIETGVEFAHTFEIYAEAIRKTEKALVCIIDGEYIAVPDSQISDSSEIWKPGDKGQLVVNEWWAEKAGLL